MALLEIRLLGRFRVLRDGRDVTPGAPERLRVLAALVLERGRPVPVGVLADVVRPGGHPLDPEALVRGQVLAVDTLLHSTTRTRFAVAGDATGWTLVLPDPCTDLDALDERLGSAQRLAASGQPAEALRELEQALDPADAEPLEDLPGPFFARHRARLEQRLEEVGVRLAGLLATDPQDGSVDELARLSRRFPGAVPIWQLRAEAELALGRARSAIEVCDAAQRALGRPVGSPEPAGLAAVRHRAHVILDEAAAAAARAARAAGLPALPRPAPKAEMRHPDLLVDLLPGWLVRSAMGRRRPAASTGADPLPGPRLRFELLQGPRVLLDDRTVPFVGSAAGLLAVLLLAEGAAVPSDIVLGRLRRDPYPYHAEEVVGELLDRVIGLVWAASGGTVRPDLEPTTRGWVLRTSGSQVDLPVLRSIAERGQQALERGRLVEGTSALRIVLDRVPRVPFRRVPGTWVAERRAEITLWRAGLATTYRTAERTLAERRTAADVARRAARAAPLDETRWEAAVLELHRSGRTADALAAYDEAERALHLGLRTGPGPRLQMLRRRITADDPQLLLP
ncbi:BTAD domain-containing putative transcriptional regulator [Kineosporia sp. A_224]|uniref:AfsR/SARP family transcriptional regulator n=1 Tax=Kineosporia sp. A_224 TaxID=1962180 RepID=UPI0013045A40|nr:BTAD domain-containing putative transcriptional regulator [Kineosporia sp. A_224]